MISCVSFLVAVAGQPAFFTQAAETIVKIWIYTDFDVGGAEVALDNAVAAGRWAFPLYDKILLPPADPTGHEAQRIFTILRRLDTDCSRYVPAARKFAVGDYIEAKVMAMQFLAKHGDKTDVKLALAFLMVVDTGVNKPCLDILSRFGGPEEARLIGAALAYTEGPWVEETRDYAKARLVEMEKRFAAEAAKPAAKP